MTPSKLLWQPSKDRIEQSNLSAFIRQVGTANYEELYTWSIEHPADFWGAIWKYAGIRCSQPYDAVLRHDPQQPHPMLGTKWFTGARLNFAENLLRFQDDRPAIIFKRENGERQELSYKALHQQVAQLANYLRSTGLKAGDRVAGFLPNIPETIIAMLATTSIGAIWSSCSPDFGHQGVLDRFRQIEPKVLFAADRYWYNGKEINCLPRVEQIVSELSSVSHVIVVSATNNQGFSQQKFVSYRSAISSLSTDIYFEQLPGNHPVYILYSSGTTGAPKCIVHGAVGTLVQHLKELMLHTDLKREDRIFYFTTCGWMMWNWLVSSLAVGATILLYDGSPFYPTPNVLFDFADAEGMTIFGTSAKYLAALEKAGASPKTTHRLSALRTMLSTGSPLLPESFDFVYQHIKQDLHLASISGGTDLISCFALGNPIAPVFRGELQTRGLGMNVRVYGDNAQGIIGQEVVGQKGELVCISAFPSMPIYFWNDQSGEKYFASYFDTYPNIWRHGDYVELTERQGMIFYGRSDAVLNPGGVRIGTAEIYSQVEQVSEVLECVAVGQDWQGEERMILFVRLQQDLALDTALQEKIKLQIRSNLTPRHIPALIVQVHDIPRTVNGKISELAIKNVIHGREVKNTSALANPEALEAIKKLMTEV